MPWVYLVISACFEVCWAIGIKFTDGFTRPWTSVFTVAIGGVAALFLSLALRTIPTGAGYAAWTGIGAVGTVLVSILLLDERMTAYRVICIGLIVFGVAGLQLTAPPAAE
jgi:quaternary ammonium compound-resistance protein SugE